MEKKNNVLKSLGAYLKTLFGDIKRAISDNINIIWGLLIASPAVFIGLFLTNHVDAVNTLHSDLSLAGIEMFTMVLVGCLNIVWAFGVIKTRRLKSSVFAAISTGIILICGILWITNFFRNVKYYTDINTFALPGVITSIVCVAFSIVLPTIGTVASFFTIDWNFKEDKF